jgi:hypothetical protein
MRQGETFSLNFRLYGCGKKEGLKRRKKKTKTAAVEKKEMDHEQDRTGKI